MIFEKIKNIINNDSFVWIMHCDEGSDPFFRKFITQNTIVSAMSFISKNKSVLLVHTLDSDNVKEFQGEKVIYKDNKTLLENMENILKSMDMPKNIYLNYSDNADPGTDVLGHGTYISLTQKIKDIYQKNKSQAPCFKSADSIIYAMTDSKNEEDIKYMKISANRALQIINDAFKKIKPGMSEKDIYNLFHRIFEEKPNYFKDLEIVSEEFSWEKTGCPIVLVGPNLTKGGHALPSNFILDFGHTIYCDFGVKICLKNGKKYASDLQRMGYVLKQGETKAPKDVQKVFDTLTEAVSLGIKNFKPSKRGYEIDFIVRNHIIKNGFPNYNHSTGHPVADTAHSPGTSIAPEGTKRSNLFLQTNGVYTIEPRIQINNGGSIEEMVLVTENGGVPLCPRQETLYLI